MPLLFFTFGKIKKASAKGGLLESDSVCHGNTSTSSSEWLEAIMQPRRYVMTRKGKLVDRHWADAKSSFYSNTIAESN